MRASDVRGYTRGSRHGYDDRDGYGQYHGRCWWG